jgi:hypothetical protein
MSDDTSTILIEAMEQRLAQLEADRKTDKAKIEALEADNAVLTQRPQPAVVAPEAQERGLHSGRCGLCGTWHQKGQCSLCPACRHPYGSPYPSTNPNDPICATCGSKPWLGPSYKSGGAIPQEIGRNMTARGATADPYYEQRAQAMAAELAKKGNGNG